MTRSEISAVAAISNDQSGPLSILRMHRWFFAGLATAAALGVSLDRAGAHDSPSGWSYPYSCCTDYDCRPVATKAVSEKPQGYVINVTGEVVPYADTRVRNSPDGEFHWCSVAGKNDTRTICLFVPPKSF